MDFINNNANVFFFVTTVFVIILIILFTVLVLSAVKLYKFVTKAVKQGDTLLEESKNNEFIKKGASIVLPILLPVFSFFMKKKSRRRK